MALACTGLPGKKQVLGPADKFEVGELPDHLLVQLGLEREIEGLEGLGLSQPADGDPSCDAMFEASPGLVAEDMLEEGARCGGLPCRPSQVLVEVGRGARQPQDGKVSLQALDEDVLGIGSS